jgi:predicted nucleic acid-binding protein
MNDLTNLTNEDLGLFIKLSLIHGVNTQFSYELLHTVAERLIAESADDYFESVWEQGFEDGYTRCKIDMGEHFEDVAETLDTILNPAIIEDNKETVEILTDIESYEAMDKAVKEAVEEVPVKKEPKKKEKPTVKESLTVETLQPVEIVEETPSITAEALKTKALEMRQKNTISRDAITAKLAEYGATTILKLDPTVYNEFNAFLESHNV